MNWQALIDPITDKLQVWMEGAAAMLPNLVVAVVVMLIFWGLSRVARRSVSWGLGQVVNPQLTGLGSRLAGVAVIGAGLVVALGVLELEKTVTSLLAGVGVVGLALGFAFQDIAANFMAGVLMAVRQPIHVGDFIETNGILGTVQAIDLRATNLLTFTGEAVMIPNKDVWGQVIKNYTETSERRIDVGCGVSYADDLERAEQVVIDALDDLPDRVADKPVTLVWDGFGGSSIDFTVRVWIAMATQPDYLGRKSEIIKRIKRAFDAEGISIPFPIRTLDFGIEGGMRLDDVMSKGSLPAPAEAK